MKKIMIALAAIALAVSANAAAMKWNTGKLMMVDADGAYTSTTLFAGKSGVTDFVMNIYLYDTDGTTLLETVTKTAAPTAPTSALSGTFETAVENGSTYYVAIDATANFGNGSAQTFLNTDKAAVAVGATGDGLANLTSMGVISSTGTQWSAVPEPTSGLLLLLGVAGLALRRKQK